jgi:hypothetical protein
MGTGHCPECKKPVTEVDTGHVNVKGDHSTFHGVSYLCPYCHCVLSVAIDPVALKEDIVSEISAALPSPD